MKRQSEFGRFCKMKRRHNRQLFIAMADATGIPRERLSAAEIGEAPPSIAWLEPVSTFLVLSEIEKRRLQLAIRASAKVLPDEDAQECAFAAFSDNYPEQINE